MLSLKARRIAGEPTCRGIVDGAGVIPPRPLWMRNHHRCWPVFRHHFFELLALGDSHLKNRLRIAYGCQLVLDITPILPFERTQEHDLCFLSIVDRSHGTLLEVRV